jgi:RNA polymerase sigma factor (sigma-70 family)
MSQENKIRISDFFKAEYGRLKSYTRSLQRDLSDLEAEDIIQDVALNLFGRADVQSPVENLLAYVYRSLRNKIIDLQRKRKNSLTRHTLPAYAEEMSLMDKSTAPAEMDAATREELYDAMYELLDHMKPEQRDILWETEYEGRSFREISEETGVPVGTLLARKHRAIAELQQAFRMKYPRLWNEYFNE